METRKFVTEAQWRAINLLVAGTMKKGDIAIECGVTPQTLSNWQKNDAFRKALRKAVVDASEEALIERTRLTRVIVQLGLEEISRRFLKGKVVEEKTNHILDAIVKLTNIEQSDSKLGNKPANDNKETDGDEDQVVGGEILNDSEFRNKLRGFLKGESPEGVSEMGTKKPIKKPRR